MNKAEAGRLGGKATAAKHGTGHLAAIGKRGGETTKERHGTEHYQAAGRLGGINLHMRYIMVPFGQNNFAYFDRITHQYCFTMYPTEAGNHDQERISPA